MATIPGYQGYPSLGSTPVNTGFPGYTPQQSTTPQPAVQTSSPAPEAPLLAAYNTNLQFNFNPSYSNPILFRQPNQRQLPYSVSLPYKGVIDHSTLTNLKIYLDKCLNGYNPQEIKLSHPIHAELFNICKPIFEQMKNWPLEKKIEYLNKKVIPEIVSGCNELPYDKELAGKIPKFELLELGLRYHFFIALTMEQRGIIESCYKTHKMLPQDLDQREILLHLLATNNDIYFNSLPNMYENLIKQTVEADLSNAITKTAVQLPLDKAIAASEKFIASQLKSLQLTKPSQCGKETEAYLRIEMTRKLVTILAEQHKNTFQKTGMLDRAQLKNETDKLQPFLTKNGQFFSNWGLYAQLMIEIFELDLSSQAPFTAARAKAYQQEAEQLEALESAKKPKTLYNWTFGSVKTKQEQQQEINALALQQQETIDAAEEEWNAMIQPPPPPYPNPVTPSALVMEPQAIPVVQTPPPAPAPVQTPPPPAPQPVIQPPAPIVAAILPSIPGKNEIPLISYIDIAFEDLLKKGSDKEKWNALPGIVQKDVWRHLNYNPSLKGQAEDVARRIFNTMEIFDQMDAWNKKKFTEPNNGLDRQFVTEGQALLDILYSDQGNYQEFLRRFQALPKNALFYQYVYEMAVKANVHIESWDHEFAKYNWNRPDMLPLSTQALERCLHSKKS
jgi:hypothetical protein